MIIFIMKINSGKNKVENPCIVSSSIFLQVICIKMAQKASATTETPLMVDTSSAYYTWGKTRIV